MTTTIGVYGASGFGREVLPIIRRQLTKKTKCEIVFIDDALSTQTEINNVRAMSYSSFLNIHGSKAITLAIASSKTREKLACRIEKDGVPFFQVIDPTTIILDEVDIGVGSILCPNVQITSNVSIGKHFHANIFSYIAHDCEIGDFVTFAPKVSCNGNVIIKDHAYIGTGAMLRQGTPDKPLIIGENAVVGMGAVVTKDVPPNTTVVGNPARPLHKP